MSRRRLAESLGAGPRLALVLLLGAPLVTGCPPRRSVERPRPTAFDPLAAKRVLQDRLSSLSPTAGADTATRAAAHRDLGWLLWVHLGDPEAARVEWVKAEGLLTGAAVRPAAPWLKAGLAALADQDLAVGRATRAWAAVLLEVGRARDTARLPPIPGEDLDRLAFLAVDRLQEQLRHLAEPLPDSVFAALATAPLPPLVLSALAQTRLAIARRAGDAAAAQRFAAQAGCPASYRLSPRFGRYPRLDLSTAFGPESQAGPLQGRTQAALGCRITLRSAEGRGGVRYLETYVRSERGGAALLQLAWPEPAVVWVNGARVHGPEPAPVPFLRVLPLTLRPGENLVRLKVPVSATPRDLQLLVVAQNDSRAAGQGTKAKVSTTPGVASRPSPKAPGGLRLAKVLGATYRPLADLLEVHAALHQGLPDVGRAAAQRLEGGAPRFSFGRLVVAQLESDDPLQPQDLGRERTRPHLAKVLSSLPRAARARLHLASVLRQQDRSKDALGLLEAAPPEDADAKRILSYARIQLYLDLGWRSLAAREAASLAGRHPAWLAAWQLHHRLAVMEQSVVAMRAAAMRLRQMDATSLAHARVLAAEGRLEEALGELARVATLQPGLGAELEPVWLRRMGRHREARERLAHRLGLASWDSERRLALADVLVALGERVAAVRILSEGLVAHPEHGDYRRALLALDEIHPLEPHREAGAAAIAAYRAAAWSPGKRPVFVLDRAVIRVFPSGGRLALTHQIVHLRTKEDVHRYSEVRLPPGAEVLTLRTVKADGSTREPEEIAGKQSLSLPDVDVGDFIEAEYVSASPPEPWWRPGGFFGDSFYFQSVAAHFFRSELVVVSDPAHRITTAVQGPAPQAVVTTTQGLRVVRFTATKMACLEPEPLSANLTGLLPAVQIGAEVRWQDYLSQRRELAFGLTAVTHRVRVIAQEICHGKPGERARRAFAWVQANIEESGALQVSAAATAASRAGSRMNLLGALLRACGLTDQRTYLVWPRHQEHAEGAIAPLPAFSQPLLGVTLPGEGQAFLLPQVQQAPFGYLPPTLQRAWAVALERPEDPPRRLPDSPAAETHETHLQVVLRKDGSAVLSGKDTMRGILALQMRAAIRSVPERRLRQAMEQVFFGRHFAGATLTLLSFEHASATEKPLTLLYRLEVPSLARVEGGRLVLGAGFFPARAGRQYGALPSRRLPLQLGPVGPRRVTADIEAPPGLHLLEEPAQLTVSTPEGPRRVTAQSTREPVLFDTPFGSLRLALSRTAKGARVVRTFHVPYRVVQPTGYPAFTAVAAAWDRLETPTLVFGRR